MKLIGRSVLAFIFAISIVASCLVVFSQPAMALVCSEALSDLPATTTYRDNRSIQVYTAHFMVRFYRWLHGLNPNDHWIDLGAGDAVAIRSFIKLQLSKNKPIPYITAVTLRFTTINQLNSQNGKVLSKIGDFETMDTTSWRKAKLITDYYGVLTYSLDLHTSLQKALDLLQPNGELYVFTPLDRTEFLSGMSASKNLVQMLRQSVGIDVRQGFDPNTLMIRKTAASVQIPRFELISSTESLGPPKRTYRLLD